MFRCLAPRPWQTLCRIYLQQRAHLSQLPPRVSWPCSDKPLGFCITQTPHTHTLYHSNYAGWQSGCKGHSLRFRFPGPRGASIAWAQVQYFSTAGSSKDGPPTEPGQNGTKPTDEVLTAQSPKELTGSKPLNLPNAESIQVKVRAVLKKREYRTKFTQNNFITAVRAMKEFCLKPSDLEQLRKICRLSPHDDMEAFAVFLRSDVEAKALEVWGSMEVIAQERTLRKLERQFQKLLKKHGYGIKYTLNKFITLVIVMNSQRLQEESLLLQRGSQLSQTYREVPIPRSSNRSTFLQGPGKVLMAALCINGLNFFLKLLAWIHTGSATMLAGATHSLANTCYQAPLALGISRSLRSPEAGNQYNLTYLFPLCGGGMSIFFTCSILSWYYGITGLMHPHPIESLLWAFCILAGSFVSEGATLLVAINELRKSAQKHGFSFYEYVMQSRDPITNVVLLENAAAVLGVVMAAGCMGLTSLTGNPYYDSLGFLSVGTLLGIVTVFLNYTDRVVLYGRPIQAKHVQKLTEFLENDPAVRAIYAIQATDIGLSKIEYRYMAKVDFDRRGITRSYLEKQDIDQMLNDIQHLKTPEELEVYLLKHEENIIDTLVAEVDRLGKELKQRNPELRQVFLEIL